MYYVYVLYNSETDKFYIGFTEDLKKRFEAHRRRLTKSSARLKPEKLVYCEACLSKKDAQDRERQLKAGFGRAYLRRRLRNFLSQR